MVWVAGEVDSNDQYDDERWQISLIYKQIQSLAQHSSHSQDMADTSGVSQQTTGHFSHISYISTTGYFDPTLFRLETE